MAKAPLSDAELAAYRRHPETFFGVRLAVSRQIKSPLDLFEFFYNNYKNTPKERMLEFLKTARDFDALSRLPTDELLLVFCDRHVRAAMAESSAQ